jgi:hypothetical protein
MHPSRESAIRAFRLKNRGEVVSDLGDDDNRSGNGLVTIAVACALGCGLVLLVAIVDLITFGSLFWAVTIVLVLVVAAGAYLLHRLPPIDPAVAAAREAERVEREAQYAERQAAAAQFVGHQAASAPHPAPTAAGQKALGRRDKDLELLLADETGSATNSAANKLGLGDLQGQIANLRKTFVETKRKTKPQVWAALAHELGENYLELGRRRSSTGLFSDAVLALEDFKSAVRVFRRALLERTRETGGSEYALTQYKIGLALLEVARREPSPETPGEAIAALAEALRVYEPGSEEAIDAQAALEEAQQLVTREDPEQREQWSEF